MKEDKVAVGLMSLWPRLRRRVMAQAAQQQQRGSSSKRANPFAGGGLEKFQEVYKELNARRRIIAAQTGTDESSVRFTAASHTGEWIHVLPRPSADASFTSSPRLPLSPSLIAANLDTAQSNMIDVVGVDNIVAMAGVQKVRPVGKTTGWAASKVRLVCFMRNEWCKKISKVSVGLMILSVVFICFGKFYVLAAIAASMAFLTSWAFWRLTRRITQFLQLLTNHKYHQSDARFTVHHEEPSHMEITGTAAFDHGFEGGDSSLISSQVRPQSALPSPKTLISSSEQSSSSNSRAQTMSGSAQISGKKSRSLNVWRKCRSSSDMKPLISAKMEDRIVRASSDETSLRTAAGKVLLPDQRASARQQTQRHLVSQRHPSTANTELSSAYNSRGSGGILTLLVVLSTIPLGQVQAIILTTCFFVLHLLLSTHRHRQQKLLQKAVINISSSSASKGRSEVARNGIMASSSVTFRNNNVLDITSQEYRKKVILEGLIQRSNRHHRWKAP